jgi:hypothetical protein
MSIYVYNILSLIEKIHFFIPTLFTLSQFKIHTNSKIHLGAAGPFEQEPTVMNVFLSRYPYEFIKNLWLVVG